MRSKVSLLLLLSLSVSCFPLFSQIQLLNDEFDNTQTLDANWLNINNTEQWNAEHLEEIDINITGTDQLHMMPYTCAWYNDYRTNLIYKELSGDFVLTTEVTVTNRNQNGYPSSTFSLGGLMIRSPRNYPNGALVDWTPGGENYIFLALGYASGTAPNLEVKSTINSSSNLSITNVPTSSDVQIRIARIGTAVIVLYQLPNSNTWIVHRRYERTDFPNTLQIGFVAYTDWPKVSSYSYVFHNTNVLNSNLNPDPSSGLPFNPDNVSRFEFARFDSVFTPPSLQGVNLVTQASDGDLLGFLGYSSMEFCPNTLQISSPISNQNIVQISAVNELNANNNIDGNASVSYSAGQTILLQSGFSAEANSELNLIIGNCPF